jgi:hypothetical protein
MKSFQKQFSECAEEGKHGAGVFKSFKDNPGLLPAFPNKKMLKDLKNGDWTGVRTIECLRFGGECSSANDSCRKMRKGVDKN